MKRFVLMSVMALAFNVPTAFAQLKSGPPLPHKVVDGWPKLPNGWNFGECSAVAVDKDDSVWVFHRGEHPVMQFDRDGNLLQSWGDGLFKSPHGLTLDPDGNLWLVDVQGHMVFKTNRQGRILMVLGDKQGTPGTNDSKEAFNQPTRVAFGHNGDFFVSDGYINSRVVKYNRNVEYVSQWGTKGTGDGQFDLVHDIVLDSRNRVYVADRNNNRVQIFDTNGNFLGKWTDLGTPFGLAYSAPEDAMYIADGRNGRVIKVNLNGEILGVLGSPGRIPGRFQMAHSIAVDSHGDIYVAEIRNWRVQKFAKP